MLKAVWLALKRSLHSKTDDPSEVSADPARSRCKDRTRNCGCWRSVWSLGDPAERLPSWSPRSIASSAFVNPVTHEVVFDHSKCEVKITRCINNTDSARPAKSGTGSAALAGGGGGAFQMTKRYPRVGPDSMCGNLPVLPCQKCGEEFKKLDAVEAHHLSKHAVTELTEGDLSRKIVEKICRASWFRSGTGMGQIDRVLKVHNTQKNLARFEEYREMVKTRASKLSKKHPRCLADGNELLRFYATVLACPLGTRSSGICGSKKCRVCRILRHGFPSKEETNNPIGILTASTSGRAMESICLGEEDRSLRKALVVCRVIAGRVRKAPENFQETAISPSFDSVAGKLDRFSNVEELYVLNPKALLPCFVVVICRP